MKNRHLSNQSDHNSISQRQKNGNQESPYSENSFQTTNKQSIERVNKNKFAFTKNTSLMHHTNTYVNLGITKGSPEISRSNFPFCIDYELEQDKNKTIKSQLKITNRIKVYEKQNPPISGFRNNGIEKQVPPVNQYLCYDLSQQITSGIYDVKVLAEEIKHIKRKKQNIFDQKQKLKPLNKIRIKRQTRVRGTLLRDSQRNKNSFLQRPPI